MKTSRNLEESLTTEFATIWRVLKAADTDLQAHKNAIKTLLTNHQELEQDLAAFLASARQDHALAEKMNQKYVRVLETLIRKLPDYLPPKVLEQLESLENLD